MRSGLFANSQCLTIDCLVVTREKRKLRRGESKQQLDLVIQINLIIKRHIDIMGLGM